ncbi:MAG: hypothetical protein KC478_16410, partial [Bacteriovoracaceae bacterium]|nr:hypothetical protein [Bacteriovoracaceae bacterium]
MINYLLAPLKLEKVSEKKSLLFFLSMGAFFHFLAPLFSEGFHRLDEQTGILRFLALKLGTLSETDMIAEYPMKIRPWLQPAFYYLFAKPLQLVGLENPFHLAWVLRATSSFIGLFSLGVFYLSSRTFLQKESSRIVFLYFLFTLWFLPFFHARTTAENLGISLFLIGMTPILARRNSVPWTVPAPLALISGIIFALSFVLRFQMSVMIFFSVLWFPLFGKMKWSSFFTISVGI